MLIRKIYVRLKLYLFTKNIVKNKKIESYFKRFSHIKSYLRLALAPFRNKSQRIESFETKKMRKSIFIMRAEPKGLGTTLHKQTDE